MNSESICDGRDQRNSFRGGFLNKVTFELHFERWAGFHFVEIESLGDGAEREKAFQWGIQDAAVNELLLFVVLEEDCGYNIFRHSS